MLELGTGTFSLAECPSSAHRRAANATANAGSIIIERRATTGNTGPHYLLASASHWLYAPKCSHRETGSIASQLLTSSSAPQWLGKWAVPRLSCRFEFAERLGASRTGRSFRRCRREVVELGRLLVVADKFPVPFPHGELVAHPRVQQVVGPCAGFADQPERTHIDTFAPPARTTTE